MAKCAECGESVPLPYLCRRCQKYFCAKHRLPESHNCTGALEIGKRDLTEKVSTEGSPPQQPIEFRLPKDVGKNEGSDKPSYYYESTYWQPYTLKKRGTRFSRTEVLNLLIASGLLVLLSLSWEFGSLLITNPTNFDLTTFLLLTAILFLSFLPHELMHKVVAQRYGLFAEFRIIPYYALLTVLFLFLPGGFKIFAPGAVMIGGDATLQTYGKTAAAGPATNLITGVTMLGLGFVLPDLTIFFFGAYLCGWLAFFNMIPVAPLDGEKVLHWSKATFALLIVGSFSLFILGIRVLS